MLQGRAQVGMSIRTGQGGGQGGGQRARRPCEGKAAGGPREGEGARSQGWGRDSP